MLLVAESGVGMQPPCSCAHFLEFHAARRMKPFPLVTLVLVLCSYSATAQLPAVNYCACFNDANLQQPSTFIGGYPVTATGSTSTCQTSQCVALGSSATLSTAAYTQSSANAFLVLQSGCSSLPVTVLNSTQTDCNSLCFQGFLVSLGSTPAIEDILQPYTLTSFTTAQNTAVSSCNCGAIMVNSTAPFSGSWDTPNSNYMGAATITGSGATVTISVTPNGGSACALTYAVQTGSAFGAQVSSSPAVRRVFAIFTTLVAAAAAATIF